MSYFLLNIIFLSLSLCFMVVATIVSRKRGNHSSRERVWGSLAFTLVIMLITTAVFDNVIIGTGLVAYDPNTLLGIMINQAPIEDFAYTIAAVMILPALWTLLGVKKNSHD